MASRPKASQFPKGHSGNPTDVRKDRRTYQSLLTKSLNETVIVNENGRRKTITKAEAIAKQLVNKAIAGDPRTAKLLIDCMRQGYN